MLKVNTMLYTLIGLTTAAVFGIGAVNVYGLDGLMEQAWVDPVFWGLIAAGAIVALVGPPVRCWLCALSARFKNIRLLCQGSPCLHA